MGEATRLWALAVLMIRPHFFGFIAGTASRVVWKAEDRLIAMIASHFSGGKSSTGDDMLDAGIVDEDVRPAELIGAALHHRFDLGRLGHVGAVVDRSELARIPASISAGVAEPVDHQLRAFGSERLGDRQADARGRPRDERDLTFENHAVLLAVR